MSFMLSLPLIYVKKIYYIELLIAQLKYTLLTFEIAINTLTTFVPFYGT